MNAASDKIYDWLAYHARHNADSPACVDLGTGRRFTYAQLNERSTRLATGLSARHAVRKGGRVAIIATNSTDFFELMFACWKLGAVFMPLNWRLHRVEIAALLAPRKGMQVSPDQVLEQCRANLARYKIPKQVVIVDELPINPQGKVLKTELRRRYAGGAGSGLK